MSAKKISVIARIAQKYNTIDNVGIWEGPHSFLGFASFWLLDFGFFKAFASVAFRQSSI